VWPRLGASERAREEAQAILCGASRADPETLAFMTAELRTQAAAAPPRVQAEIDGVIARFRAAHPERPSGGDDTVNGPTTLGPEDDDVDK
jgi:hypothetical protein